MLAEFFDKEWALPGAVKLEGVVDGGATFDTNLWHFGYSPHMSHSGITPNGACMLRVLVHGSMAVTAVPLSELLDSSLAIAEPCDHIDYIESAWASLNAEKIKD